MARHQQQRHALAGAESFRVNGWTPFGSTDSTLYYEQAHGMLSFINSAIVEDVEAAVGPMNPTILHSALLGVQTLLSLGILAQDNERIAVVGAEARV